MRSHGVTTAARLSALRAGIRLAMAAKQTAGGAAK
jgi:hypothetical protein